MSDRRLFRLATTSARLLAGTVVAAAFGTAVVTAVALPWPTLTRTPLSVAADPAPADTVAACAGPLLVLGRDPERADALQVAATQDVVVGSPSEAPAPVEGALTTSVPDSDGPAVFTVEPRDRVRSEVAASGSAAVADDDLVGFAASACLTPLIDSWIVGGATTTGANDLLLLANPGAVPATVQLTVYTATGAQIPPGGADLVVAAGEQRVVPLAGLVLGEESPVVRITATGAPVQAALQSSVTRTLVPGGIDQENVAAPAATTQVIPGIAVTTAPSPGGAPDATTVLRLLAPDQDTTATVVVVGPDGASESPAVPLTAGLPAQVDLSGFAVGTYTVRVDAGAPVVAAVKQSTGFDAGSDFAWYPAAPALTTAALVAVPDGPSPTLWLFNAGDEATTVTVQSLTGGDSTQVTVEAGRAASRTAAAGDVYRLTAADVHVRAMVSFAGTGALAGFPVWPEDAAAGTVVVYP